jgi:uncharacterized protein YecE (DUF72 family)
MTKTRDVDVRVGTAGWSIASAHRHAFGEGESMLARYATRFDLAEINSSFHRPHQRKTYERWAASVPASFRFAVKLPRTVSHELGLRASSSPTARFVEECTGLGAKLAAVLVQLPPSLVFDGRVASPFFRMLARYLPAGVHVACEPRHASWSSPGADKLLQRLDINRVGADPPRMGPDVRPSDWGSCRYWRFHGSPHVYYSGYDDQRLKAFSEQVHRYGRSKPNFVIFDNTTLGHATVDGLNFRTLFSPRELRVASRR